MLSRQKDFRPTNTHKTKIASLSSMINSIKISEGFSVTYLLGQNKIFD